jgi:hypothetical protein
VLDRRAVDAEAGDHTALETWPHDPPDQTATER